MAKIKIGCGWYVLAALGGLTWAANKWAPNHVAGAKRAVWAKVPKPHLPELPFLHKGTPSPAPTPQLATPAPTSQSATPSPAPTEEPAAPLPQATPEPIAEGSGSVSTEEVRAGTGRTAALGQAVRIRCALLGSGGETLGGSSDFLFMVGSGEVAPGLDKAVMGMKAGGKRRATIPAALLKGPLPSGVEVSGESLRCEIELTEVL